jgi:hypothetical protein
VLPQKGHQSTVALPSRIKGGANTPKDTSTPRDSKNIIHFFVLGTNPKDTKLQRIIDRTKALLSSIQANFYHILRGNNREADRMANQAIRMAPGSLKVQGRVLFIAPP